MRHILQVRLADIADHDEEGLLPHEGHLWVFLNDTLESSSMAGAKKRHPVVHVAYAEAGATLVRTPRPGGEELPPLALRFARVMTLPADRPPHLNTDKLSGDYTTLVARYADALYEATAPSYLLGHVSAPDWSGEVKKKDRQLLQIEGGLVAAEGFDVVHF